MKKVCAIYTETNGQHTTDEDVSKKYLFGFARLVILNYEIFNYENNTFKTIKQVRTIIKPRCMYINEESTKVHGITNEYAEENGQDIEQVLNDFKNDLKDVKVLVSHDVAFHLKTIYAEYVRYNIQFNPKNFMVIDTISFFHSYEKPGLKILYENLYPKDKENTDTNLELIKKCFLKLYKDYRNSVFN